MAATTALPTFPFLTFSLGRLNGWPLGQEERQRASKGDRKRLREHRVRPEAFRNARAPVPGTKEKWNVHGLQTIGYGTDVFVAKVTVEYDGRNVVRAEELQRASNAGDQSDRCAVAIQERLGRRNDDCVG